MYQNMPQMQSNSYYQYPYAQRIAQLEQQQSQMGSYGMMNNMNKSYIKGRPVVSLEEARATQIDLDGSLFVFTDIGNQKIYTKQINLDGTASLNTYSLVENANPTENYVTKSELEEAIALIKTQLEKGKNDESIKQQQFNSTQTTVRTSSAF